MEGKNAATTVLAALVAALVALLVALPGAARADVVGSTCGVTCDDGGGYDFTTEQLDGPFQATPVSPATVSADVSTGGYAVESGQSFLDATAAPCKMHPPDGCVPLVCYRTGNHPLATRWGKYPAGQAVYEDREWCGYANWYQTYRASRLRTGTGGAGSICSAGAPYYNFKTAGGNGYFFTAVHTGAQFTCNVWPGLSAHFQDYQVWSCNMSGYCTETDHGHE
jgi:hypothetical protein